MCLFHSGCLKCNELRWGILEENKNYKNMWGKLMLPVIPPWYEYRRHCVPRHQLVATHPNVPSHSHPLNDWQSWPSPFPWMFWALGGIWHDCDLVRFRWVSGRVGFKTRCDGESAFLTQFKANFHSIKTDEWQWKPYKKRVKNTKIELKIDAFKWVFKCFTAKWRSWIIRYDFELTDLEF